MLSYHKNVNVATKRTQKRYYPPANNIFFMHPMGFEPIVQASEACVVSIPLWVLKKQPGKNPAYAFLTLSFLRDDLLLVV